MKRALLLSLAIFTMLAAFSQSEKFVKVMEEKLVGFDTTRDAEKVQDYANTFERIAEAEKTQWLPYYYAAPSNVTLGYHHAMAAGPMGGNADKIDPLADKAEQLLKKAEELSKNNDEIYIVKKQLATLRMLGDVMNRYMIYGPAAAEALATAKKLNPENPRIYVLEGTDQFNTPEEYGGSKTEAKKSLELAVQKYDAFKPLSSIHPTWGRQQAEYFLSMIK